MAGASLRVGANTSEFTSQMKSMLTQMKLVTSEYKVEAAQAKALGNQTDLLKAKKTELTSKIKLQTDAIKLQETNLTAQKQKLTELIEKEDKAKQKVAELTKAHEDSVKATGKDSEESQKLNAQLEEAKEAHAKATNAVKKQEDAIAKNTVKLNESKAALTEQNTALKNTEEELTNAGKKWTVFGQEIQTAGSNMDEAGNKTLSLGDVIKANLISSAIISGVKELANGIKELAKGAISVGMDFESGMSQVAATMGMTTQEIAGGSEAYTKLENAAKEAGNTTQFSATQAAEALNYMALAGYDADKAVETLPTVLNLAAAGGMDLATASDMVTDSMSALGDKAGTTESFVDKMAKTSQKSNTSVQQLGEALLTVGGTAKSLAGGVTEANTVLGIFADSGTKGAEGGTALRNVILSLTAPTDTAKKKMQELGLEVFDANGNMRPLNETFQDLNGILGDMTQGEQTEVLNTIFNKVDLKSVNALLANSGERFNELSGYIENSTGAAENMAATMNDNLQGKITILKSGLEGLGIAAYEKFETPLKNAVTNITNVIGDLQTDLTSGELSGALDKIATGFGNLVEKASEIIVAVLPKILEGLGWIADHGDTIASILAAIGAGFAVFKVASIINGVVTAIQGLTAAEVALNTIQKLVNVTMAANPMMLIITLVATLVAAIVGFVATNENARTAVVNAWNVVKDTIGKVVGEIAKFFTETIPNALSKVVDFVKDNWQDILLLLANPFAGAVKLLYEHCESFRNIVDNIASFFQELPGKIWDAILGAVTIVTTWGENMKTAVVQAATEFVTNAVTFFQELPYKIGYVIGQAIGNVVQFGIDLVTWATTEIPNFINTVITFLVELPGKIWNAIVSAITNVQNWGQQIYTQATNYIQNTITTVVNFLSQLPGKIWNAIVSAITNMANWGQQMLSQASAAASNILSNVYSTLSQMPGRVWNAIQGAIQSVANWGSGLLQQGRNAASQLVSAVINGVASLPSQMASVGYNIVTGVWNGICNAAGWFRRQVQSFFSGIVDGVKNALGIHSPSRVFQDEIGKYMAQGAGVGFTNELGNVEEDINKSLGTLTKNVAKITPITEVKQSAKVVALNNRVDTTQFTDNSEKTVIVEITNITELDGKEIARKTTKRVVKNVTKEQKNKQKAKGAA
jgi:TP901 family phage tail tape measure protein